MPNRQWTVLNELPHPFNWNFFLLEQGCYIKYYLLKLCNLNSTDLWKLANVNWLLGCPISGQTPSDPYQLSISTTMKAVLSVTRMLEASVSCPDQGSHGTYHPAVTSPECLWLTFIQQITIGWVNNTHFDTILETGRSVSAWLAWDKHLLLSRS